MPACRCATRRPGRGRAPHARPGRGASEDQGATPMDTQLKKAANRVRAGVAKRRGPAEADQTATPIADAIDAFWQDDRLTFAIPAHTGGRGPEPAFARWAGHQAARVDLPVSHGVDTRDRAWQVQATAQQLFAEATGAKETFFSTNGSTLNVHVAMMTVARPGETVVVSRYAHKSLFSGLILSGARPVYLEPVYDADLALAHVPRAEDLEALLAAHPEAVAAMVVSPSYYGTAADVRSFADICHSRDVPLVVDAAWGLDFALAGHPELPEGALAQGADIAIGSVHKTMSGLGQTSVMSVGSDERIDMDRLSLTAELEDSTSPAALLLSSIDGARHQFVHEGEELLRRAVSSAHLLRERLAVEVPELRVVGIDELCQRPGVADVDPTHVIIEVSSVGLTGYQADDWLRDERGVDIELVDHRRLVPIVMYAHGEPEIDRLGRALRDLVDEIGGEEAEPPVQLPAPDELRTEQAMLPRDAFLAQAETVKLNSAVGRVSAELVTPYPPGIPVAARGEVYTQAIVDYLDEFAPAGGFVEGAADPSLANLRVVA